MSHPLPKALFLPLLLAAAGAPAQAHAGDGREQIALPENRVTGEAGERAEDALASRPESGPVPAEIGPYRLVRELGSGGMGTVYLARSIEHAEREVALKIIRPGLVSPALLAQFGLERRALSAADHDHVARLFDAGTTGDGRPWFAMEYVRGEPITAFADRRRLDIEQRLELFVDVCHAVQHLHERGILHGDLKPDNILVAERRGRLVPKIIDLGLARLHGRAHDDPEAIAGTPAYMAPERFTLRPAELDERSDVFSLGVILCELLAGARPEGWLMNAVLAAGAADRCAARSTLSACLDELGSARSGIARQRGSTPGLLRLRLIGALDRIARRAIEPRRERRCASAGLLASSLERDHSRHAQWTRFAATGAWVAAAAAAGLASGSLLASAS
jgi:serine/threonine protein kinase